MDATGTLLASATFTNETASGWQNVLFSSPVPITAGTTYSPGTSRRAATTRHARGFRSAVDNPPLHAIANGTTANGVYAYSATSTFPTNTYNATNYWVDVLFRRRRPASRRV